MLAAVYRKEAKGLKIEEIPESVPGVGQVKVKVSYASICGSDLFLVGSRGLPEGTVLGHEMSGVVEILGQGVPGLRPGQPVIVRPMGCGACGPCMRQEENLCPKRQAIGLGDLPGAFAQYVVVPQGMIIPVPEGLDLKIAALAEPLATALHAIRLAGIGSGDRVVVLGAGGIGLCSVALLRALGVRRILVSEPQEGRRNRALALGAQRVVDPMAEDLGAALEEWKGQEGVTAVMECAGNTETTKTALQILAPGGKLALVGLVKGTVDWMPALAMLRQIRIQGSFANTQAECRECLGMMARGELRVEPMLEGVIPLRELPTCMERLLQTPGDGKLIVEVNRGQPGSSST